MMVLGLTGSIGMGKSTVAAWARGMGIPVFDADAAVHALLGPQGKAVAAVNAAFPGVVETGAVNRGRLGAAVFGHPEKLAKLESILHPLVRQAQNRFLHRCRIRHAALVALDVPLLLEKDGWRACRRIAVVTAPPFVQAQRVLARPGATAERLDAIRAAQMPEWAKRHLADFVIPTGLGKPVALRALKRAVRLCRKTTGAAACAKSYWIRKPRGWTP